MREFKTKFYGDIVDLDSTETYEYLSKDIKVLREQIYAEFGKAVCYMDGFHPDRYPKEKSGKNEWGYNQRQRVYKLMKDFTAGAIQQYNNIQWYQEQIFLMQDECENMC
jgi:hypothetical protein